MSILITGYSGYIGKLLMPQLHHAKKDILTIGRSRDKKPDIYVKDVFSVNCNSWKNILTQVETVVHLAWIATPGVYQNSLKNEICYSGSKNLIDACQLSNSVRKVVIAGSAIDQVGIKKIIGTKDINYYSKYKSELYNYAYEKIPQKLIFF